MTASALAILGPIALASRLLAGTWLAPASLYAGYWLVATLAPLVLFDDSEVTLRAILYLSAGAAVFALGATTTSPTGRQLDSNNQPTDAIRLNARILRLGTMAGTGAAIIATALALYANGLPPASVLSIDGLVNAGNSIAVARYQELEPSPTGVPVLLTLAYTAALIAPLTRLTGMTWWWSFAPVLGSLAYSTVTTERFAFLLTGALTAGSLLATQTMAEGRPPRVSTRAVTAVIVVALLVTAAFAAIALIRTGGTDERHIAAVRRSIGVYAFGYQGAFSGWLEGNETTFPGPEPLRYGATTIALVGLPEIAFGSADRDGQRRYSDFTQVNSLGQRSNIYTANRGLIVDFGRSGAVVFLFLLGVAAGGAYRRTVRRRCPITAVALACIYAAILLSVVHSIFTFTNMCAAGVLALILVARSHRGSWSDATSRHRASCRLPALLAALDRCDNPRGPQPSLVPSGPPARGRHGTLMAGRRPPSKHGHEP